MANKLGARWASMIGAAYAQPGLRPRRGVEVERVGLPLRPAIARLASDLEHDRTATRKAAAAQLGVDPDRPLVVITGGSLGAVNVNRAVAASAKDLLAFLGVGKRRRGRARRAWPRPRFGWRLPCGSLSGTHRSGVRLRRSDHLPFRSRHGQRADGFGTAGDLRASADRQWRAAFQRAARGRRGRGLDGGGWRFHPGLGPWPCAGTACRSSCGGGADRRTSCPDTVPTRGNTASATPPKSWRSACSR